MARPIVVFNCARNYEPGSIEHDFPRMVEACEIRLTEAKDGPDLAAALAEADVLIARRDYVGIKTLELSRNLKGIVTPGVGVEKVDVQAATELGIVVANSPGNSITVAESTLLLMLALAKQMPIWVAAAKAGKEPTSMMRGMELRGKTLGIVGLGRIGKLVSGFARAFGMRVLAYDPYVPSSDVAELVSLETVLRQSDFVSCHPVLTPETFHLINAERLALMKPTAFLVNTSRGGVIDEPALIEALRQERLAGAGLDVFETEPPDPKNPLLQMDNVIGTPHGLSHAFESVERCSQMTQENVLAIIEGRLPPYIVNPTVSWRAQKVGV
ncbi:MAG: hydroxyacid dehydrogenase [Chloroflexi bacterium]|nr:hydroxyacid dehydrogenase [Chloroflexota bacterium]MBV9897933.1 hydroxyacid dehydrogenase [Chloroflexota bacterium]